MKRAGTVEELLADPVGRFVSGPTHVVWCSSASLAGTTHWGRPTARDACDFLRSLELVAHPRLATGFDALTDARALEVLELPPLPVVAGHVGERLSAWNARVRRHAIVIPPGMIGALVAGVVALVGPHHAVRFFHSVEEARDWLGRGELPAVLEDVASIVEAASSLSPALCALRAYLERSLHDATLGGAAEALRMSPRTLQRELHRLGICFKSEQLRARLRRACVHLQMSNEKVDLVAQRVGLSPSQFHTTFRRLIGETPSAYRARFRR